MPENRRIVSKGWGYESIIVNKPEYCGKILHFDKGKKCSLHRHVVKDETFLISYGAIQITYGYSEDALLTKVMNTGDTMHIPVGLLHQMKALTEAEIIEF